MAPNIVDSHDKDFGGFVEPKHYLGLREVGALFGVPAATVSKWRTRYADTDHPCPDPTAWIGDTPGWDNASTWKGWKAALPGQGAGGGPLPLGAAARELTRALDEVGKRAQGDDSRMKLRALHLAAAQYGFDKDTAMAVWARVAESDPHMPTHEVDQRALATMMRGRAKTGSPADPRP